MEKVTKYKITFYSILTAVAFSLDYHIVEDDVISSQVITGDTFYANITNMFLKLLYAIKFNGIMTVIFVIACCYVYRRTIDHEKAGRLGIYEIDEVIIGVLMSLTYFFGRSFHEFGTSQILVTGWTQIIKSCIVLAGSLVFFVNVVKFVKKHIKKNLYSIVNAENKNDTDNREIYRIKLFLLFAAVWSLYLVAYYPGMFMGDTEDTIYMAFNFHCVLADTVELVSGDVMLVDHHSVLHTLIVGVFVSAGRMIFHSDNAGIFLYTIFQMTLTAWVLACALYKFGGYGVSRRIRVVITLFFCLFPWIPKYAIMITKDTLFVDFLLLYLLELLDIINNDNDKFQMGSMIKLTVYMVLITLFRKNGFYVTVLSLPFLIKINKKWLGSVCCIMLIIISLKIVYSNIVLPAAGITAGSVRESLSVPIQQTGRYLKYYADEVTNDERAAIDAVVPYDIILSSYSANSSDPIKNNPPPDKERKA